MTMPRKSYWSALALLISILGVLTLAFLTGCGGSSSSSTTPPPTVTITATSGSNQSAAIGTAFANPLAATVTTGGTPTSGVTVTFTAPASGASGTFATSTPGATDTETTNSSGVATSQVFTANTTAGAYSITAAVSGASTPASFSLTNTAGAAANLTATSGTPQNVAVNTTAAPLVAQVTDSHGNGVPGVSVTFTASTAGGATGTFTSTTTSTETDMTDANGNATASDFVANATTGGPYNVVATSGTLTAVNFVLTNVVPVVQPLAAGNYVYYVSGEDNNTSGRGGPYYVAGVFTVNSSGAITGGEQSYSDDFIYEQDNISATGSSVAAGNNGNVVITLNTGDASIGVAGVEIFDANMVSTSNGLLTEYDTWASGSGTLDLQTSMAAPSGGYAFTNAGIDLNGLPVAIGGVINVDSAGGISGTGSVFDENDYGTLSSDQPFAASTVTGPDSFGQVVFDLNPQNSGSTLAEFEMVGYIVDADHIRWVENWNDDVLGANAGGTALGQGTSVGTYGTSSLSGSSGIFGAVGYDANGPLQTAGLLNFIADGSVTGNVSFNDFVALSPQGGTALAAETTPCTPGPALTGCYVVDSTGRVTITNVTDSTSAPTFNYNFQLYLAKAGATVISMDATNPNGPDVLAGLGYGQTGAGSFTASSFNGNYTLNVSQHDTDSPPSYFEYDGIGAVVANGVSAFTGFLDLNGSAGVPFTPTNGTAGGVTGTFAANANGVFTGTITGIDTVDPATPDNFTFYLIGGTGSATTGVIGIENDITEQLSFATFELQQ
jgi:hypothetical protein